MSPSKQKSTEKQVTRDRKVSSRQTPASGGTPASAYNPLSGTFCALESVSPDPGTGNHNGRLRSMDDVGDPATANGVGAESECMSNNGSCSGESEDQLHVHGKDKLGVEKLGTISGLVGDLDKRDKVRGKNERKHQRQKERRAQELREKCNGYLMSRKLEALSQQLVAMGFSQERATMALIVNDGHVEQSVAWLLEGCEGQVDKDWNIGSNPKIDISEELGLILDVEKKYNVMRAEIERAVVSCEGDLDKALDCIRVRRLKSSPGQAESHKLYGASNNVPNANVKEESLLSDPAIPCSSGVTQTRVNGICRPANKTRREDIDVLYTKGRLQNSSGSSVPILEVSARGAVQGSSLPNPLTSSQGSLSPADRRGYSPVARPPLKTASSPHVSHYIHAASADRRVDTVLKLDSGGMDSNMGCLSGRNPVKRKSSKEPEIATQGLCFSSQLTTSKGAGLVSSMPSFSPPSGGHGSRDMRPPSRTPYPGLTSGSGEFNGPCVGNTSLDNLTMGFADLQGHHHSFDSTQLDSLASQWALLAKRSSNQDVEVPVSNFVRSGGDSWISSMTSYGLYTGWGTGPSHSSADWSMGPLTNCDYRNIDWSVSASPPSTAEVGCLWGLSNNLTSLKLQEKGIPSFNLEEVRGYQAISENARRATESSNVFGVKKLMSSRPGVQDITYSEHGKTTPLGVHEWTSPFTGKDVFSLPQLVTSPSL